MAKKKKTTAKLKQDLQKLFNKRIRERDSDGITFTCISCGQTKPVEQMNAGHFFAVGGYDGLRFDEDNVHGECVYCNCFNESHLIKYTINLQGKIGMTRFNKLLEKAQNYKRSGTVYSINGQETKWHRPEVEALIEYYKSLK